MKTLSLVLFGVFAGLTLLAQNTGPVPKINQQMTDFFSYYPKEKVFIMTGKNFYKPGETIWFRAFVTDANNLPAPDESLELVVKLYDKNGKQVLRKTFRLKNGSSPGDLLIPADLPKGLYFLAANTSAHILPEEISYTALTIDPEYSNQWVASVVAKDSISVSGQKNEIYLILQDVSGDIQKNTSLRYQLLNGNEILEKGKLKTDEKGKAVIPVTLPAKTNGEPFILELSDAKGEWKKEVYLPSNLDPVEIKFFPEGGNLITGTPAKIGFTAFNKWGIPVDIEGMVLDQNGKSVALVKSFTKGLGLFSVINDGKQKFKLVLSGKTGQNQSFELPAPKPDGLAFSVVKTDAGFVSANMVFADNKKHSIALTATHGSNLYWAADMEIDGVGRIKIPTENLPQGINLLSVFSAEGKLLAGRIVFTDKNQQLHIDVQAEKTSLKQNESMTVKIRLTDENDQPVAGNLAISITDKFLNSPVKTQIDEYLIIGSEVETPFSLISGALKGKIGNSALLDVFLIANHPKGFNWEKIQTFKSGNTPDINMVNNGISGIVTDKNGNKINKAKVSLVNNKSMQIFTTTSNADGFFAFPNLNTANAEDFSAKATDPEGKRELNIDFIKNFESGISAYIANYALKYSLLNQNRISGESYFKNNQDLFPRIPRIFKPNTTALDNQRRLLSSSTSLMDVIKTIKPYKLMNNQIVFIGSENSLNYQGGALVVLDGQQLGTDISSIQNISPTEVDHINVSTNPMDIQRYTGLNSVGVIEIYLKRASFPDPETKNEPTSQYDGSYRVPNVFPTEPDNPKRDYRTILVWIPEQKVDETGSVEFTLTASKVLSDFVIEVQGISVNGRAGSSTTYFSVIK